MIPLAEPSITEQDQHSVAAQLASTFVGPGNRVLEFGRTIAGLSQRQHAQPVCSGTVALSLAALAMGLKAGDEVLLPAYGVLSVINAFKSVGLEPRLVDIDPRTGCMNPELLQVAITPKTRAVCYVSFLGNIGASLQRIRQLCDEAGLILIEDAAWSLGRMLDNVAGGSVGDIAITSFSVPKIITTGQGGAVMTDSDEVKNKLIRLVDQGGLAWRQSNQIETVGSNLRMCDINAALGLSQLDAIAQRYAHKQHIFLAINDILEGRVLAPEDGLFPMQNVIFVQDVKTAMSAIREAGVSATSQYCVYSQLAPYRYLDQTSFPGGEFWQQHGLYLPFGIGTSEETMIQMAEKVRDLNLDYLELPTLKEV